MNKRDFNKNRYGFSLIELMVTVVIMGILATVAIPAFIGYRYRAQAQEAIDFLGIIKLRQESYRAEFGQYCDVNAPHPTSGSGPNGAPKGSENELWNPPPATWLELGLTPQRARLKFQFDVRAYVPGTAPNPNPWELSDTIFSYVATATGDLDGDGTQVTFDAIPGRKLVWCSSDKGWE